MPFASINGARLWYEIRGEGKPLLLHHGYTASRINWMPIAERLQAKYQIILMECRGTGESEDTADGYTLEQYTQDVITLIDTLGLGKITFAGHSMGGGIGYLLGLEHAERLTNLTLMAPIPAEGIAGGPSSHALDERMAARARKDRDFFKQEMVATRFREDVQTDAWFESRVDHLLRVSEGHLTGGMASMRQLDVADRLAELKVPTLMLAGAVDGLLTANIKDYQRLPDAALHVFSRAGHDVAVHEPDGVAEAIDQFMQHGPMSAAKLLARARNLSEN
ncbi:MAG: alpha/beta hydrolase [Pseudomonadota bacterium]